MYTEKEYNILMNKYNVSVSRIQDLMKTLEDKEKSYKEKDIENAQINKNAREFCEVILAKDKNEMKLSGNYTWNSLSTVDLITRAEKAYNAFNDERNGLLNKLMNEVEKRGAMIEALKDQIIILKEGNPVDDRDIEDIVNENAAKKKYEDKGGLSGNNVVMVKETDEDMEEIENDRISKAIKTEGIRTTPNGQRNIPAPKKKETVIQAKQEKNTMVVMDIMKNYEKWSDLQKKVFDIIASGQSRVDGIIRTLKNNGEQVNDRVVANTITTMSKQGVFTGTLVSTPFTPKMMLYELNDVGKTLYAKLYNGKRANESEMSKVLREHGDFSHGYGIIQLATKMKESKKYFNISEYNRGKAMPIPGTTNKYIPDIIYCTNENGKKNTHYIEYETGKSLGDRELKEKLNKMFFFTNTAEIIVENKQQLSRYLNAIDRYVKSKKLKDEEAGIPYDKRFLKGKKIKITSAKWFVENVVTGKVNEWENKYDFDIKDEVITMANPIKD